MSEPASARDDLTQRIAALYRVFARYPLRDVLDRSDRPCPDNQRLHSRPLDQLTWRELLRYAWKAQSLWGDDADYRHFLPCLLELLAFEPPHFNEEVIFRNIASAWETWPQDERAAIRHYLAALWRFILASYDPESPERTVEDALCCVAQVAEDLAPFIAAWEAASAPAATDLLADYVRDNITDLVQRRALANPWWSEARPRERQAVEWLLSPAPLERLESAYLADDRALHAPQIATAADWLRGLR